MNRRAFRVGRWHAFERTDDTILHKSRYDRRETRSITVTT